MNEWVVRLTLFPAGIYVLVCLFLFIFLPAWDDDTGWMDGWVNGHENMGMEHRKISKSGCFFSWYVRGTSVRMGNPAVVGKRERAGVCLTVLFALPFPVTPSLPFPSLPYSSW